MNFEGPNEDKFVDILIRYGLLFLLIAGSIYILLPFLILLIWGIIIAVALFPAFKRVTHRFGERRNFTALLFTVVILLMIVLPSILLTNSTMRGYQYLREAFNAGTLTIPKPTRDVAEWPVIGEPLYAAWDLASHNLKAFINRYSDQMQGIGKWMFEVITGLGLALIQFIISIIIAGFLLSRWDVGQGTTLKFARRLVGNQAEDFVKLTAGTIRSVVQGILGVSVIQTIASAICLYAASVPLAGIWSTFILILTILQLPAFIVLGPIIIYVFSTHQIVPALIFAIFAMLISISDSILKAFLLGKGTGIPTLIILLGAIGGMIVSGILGLFVGAVILALSYKLLIAWLNKEATK